MTEITPTINNPHRTMRRSMVYLVYLAVLLGVSVSFSRFSWLDMDFNHAVLETGTILIGLLALARYYTKNEGKILIIGAGLLGAGMLDTFHIVSYSQTFSGALHRSAPETVLWSFEISRLYLSVMFVLSWLDWQMKLSAHGFTRAAEIKVYVFASLLMLGCGLLFWQTPNGFVEPQSSVAETLRTIVPIPLFLIALIGYLMKGGWRQTGLDHWIILFLITNLGAQMMLLTLSPGNPEQQLQLAHEIKILAYIWLLIGMLSSMYQIFREAADTSLKIAEANIALKLEAEERLRAQAQTEEARSRAEKSDMAKSDFLSSMSHELRTPLNSILGFGQLLKTDPGISEDPNKSEAVGQILEAGHHLLELINEVLDLSRIESGNMELRSLAVPVNDTILACISLSGPLAAQRGVQTLTILTETEGSFVMADKIRFRQILLNLISNGIKYNRENGNLEITARPTDNGMIRIEVSDTGPGLNDKQIDEVFEPFNRLNAANSQIEGTGIGLTITRRLTEMMDGTIEVKSQPGTGSTFSIELPVAEAPTSQS